MYSKMIDYESVKEENKQYEEILGLKEEFPDLKFSPPCNVIARTQNDIYESFTIDKGSRDGIKIHDPVITKSGLVGIISEVELTYSKVTTILSPEYPIGVYCVETKEPGYIQGTYDIAKDGLCSMKGISLDSSIKIGDIIVTSGNSELAPKERMIGTISEVTTDKGGLTLNAKIKPIVDISQVKNVFVITAFEGQGQGVGNDK